MKIRDSGMAEQAVWESFFDPDEILRKVGLGPAGRDAVEFGCGYGTFTLPAARIVSGKLYAIDIDPDMIEATRDRAAKAGVANLELVQRDFMTAGTGLPDACADYVMLFNILHPEDPAALLADAHRILRPGGLVGIIHWNYDPTTPRGPDMSFRPRPEQCRACAEQAGFVMTRDGIVDLPPYHYGMSLRRPDLM